MAPLIIKPDPDVDFYAVLDIVMDDFLAGGPRAAWDGYWYYQPTAERFARADEFGTSEVPRPGRERWYGWDHEHFLLHCREGAHWLRRADIAEYVRRRSRGEAMDGLLEPVEDDSEPIRSWTMEELQAKWKKEQDTR